jgi:hypothetical protein
MVSICSAIVTIALRSEVDSRIDVISCVGVNSGFGIVGTGGGRFRRRGVGALDPEDPLRELLR